MTTPRKSCGSCKHFGSPMYQGQTGVCSTCDDFSNWTQHEGHRTMPQDYVTHSGTTVQVGSEKVQRAPSWADAEYQPGDPMPPGPLHRQRLAKSSEDVKGQDGRKPDILILDDLEPPRVAVLKEAIKLTSKDRNDQYGDPLISMGCAGELKDVFRKYNRLSGRRTPGSAEQEALDMVLTKLSRIATGELKMDNYVDGAAYLAAAWENAQRETTLQKARKWFSAKLDALKGLAEHEKWLA